MIMKNDIMMDYIREQAEIIERLFRNRKQIVKPVVDHLKKYPVKRIYFSGHGSPYHVSVILKPMIEQLLQIEASAETPTLFNNHGAYNVNGVYKKEEMLLICPAQSGRTSGPYFSALKAKELGIPSMCITLREDGKLAELCDIVIKKDSGEEESFPEIKGHMVSVVFLMLAVIEAAHELGKMTDQVYEEYCEKFSELPQACLRAVDATLRWYEVNKKYFLQKPNGAVVGYGENYGTALEGALKILETSLKMYAGHECEEYMHGKNQTVTRESIQFFIYSPSIPSEMERMSRLIKWCRERSEGCFVLCDSDCELRDEKAISWKQVRYPYLSAIENHIPFQVISYMLAESLGLSTIVANHDTAGKELGTRIEE